MSTDTVDQATLAAQRHRIRHSAAHVMADAITSIWPQAKLTIGPPTDDGFYYDIDLDHRLTPEDLKEVERRMRKIIGANDPFVREEISREDAQQRFAENEYKLENIAEIPEGEVITTYSHGKFTDLCEGPHVERAGAIKAVKLLNIAGAYWRGDERNPMLQRIYGTAFESKDALRQHIEMLEEAAKRDHRKVGRELELFMFDPAAPASPFFLPKGTVLYNLLIDYIRELYQRYGYQEVMTPQIFESGLWRRSGHYENYKENMFFVEIDEREFGVKPMNCPSHALIYGSTLHSYRDLPVRLADFGRLHRYERSGVTHGLTRVRSFAQDDAHIFCRPDQVQSEVTAFIDMVRETFTIFGFDDVHVMLSLRPEKRVGTDEMWERAEAALTSAIESKGLDYEAVAGEGAFYGPKIDFFMQDALRRQWQLSTVQLDYSLPERFGLEYVTEDDRRERPVLIHRALLGSLERFIAILLEHTGGALPVWLSPVQAVVIPIADRHADYAREVESRLRGTGLRVEVDARAQRMNLKIREAQLRKVPYMLVVGDREQETGAAAVRQRAGEDLGAMPLDDIAREIGERTAARS